MLSPLKTDFIFWFKFKIWQRGLFSYGKIWRKFELDPFLSDGCALNWTWSSRVLLGPRFFRWVFQFRESWLPLHFFSLIWSVFLIEFSDPHSHPFLGFFPLKKKRCCHSQNKGLGNKDCHHITELCFTSGPLVLPFVLLSVNSSTYFSLRKA